MNGQTQPDNRWDELILEVRGAELLEGEAAAAAASSNALSSFMLLYCDQGNATVHYRELNEALKRGSLYVFNPGTPVFVREKKSAKLKLYVVKFELFRAVEPDALPHRLYERQLGLLPDERCEGPGGAIRQLLALLIRPAAQSPAAVRRLQKQQVLLELLMQLAPAGGGQQREPDRQEAWLLSALKYIQEHYHRDIRVETLAEMTGLHPVYFSQQFKRFMNKSPSAFITQLRMNRAKELLRVTDKSIREIAQFVGYRDEFYFSRRFKEHTGSSPTFYVKGSSPSVISLSYPCTDHLFSLGIVPKAAQMHVNFAFDTTELRLPMHGSEAWETGRDVFLELAPDLILCKDNVLRKAREHIGDIAPILSIPWATMDVYDHLRHIAQTVDRKLNAQLWLDHYERQEERGRKLIRQSAAGATLAIVVLRPDGSLRLYSSRNVGHVFYRSLQLAPPERLRTEMAKHAPGTHLNWLELQPDRLTDYDAELLLLLVFSEEEKRRMERVLAEDPQWRSHTAIRTGRYEVLIWHSWMVYAPSSLERQLEAAVGLLNGPKLRARPG